DARSEEKVCTRNSQLLAISEHRRNSCRKFPDAGGKKIERGLGADRADEETEKQGNRECPAQDPESSAAAAAEDEHEQREQQVELLLHREAPGVKQGLV